MATPKIEFETWLSEQRAFHGDDFHISLIPGPGLATCSDKQLYAELWAMISAFEAGETHEITDLELSGR